MRLLHRCVDPGVGVWMRAGRAPLLFKRVPVAGMSAMSGGSVGSGASGASGASGSNNGDSNDGNCGNNTAGSPSPSSNNGPVLQALTAYSWSQVLAQHYAHVPKVPLYIEGRLVQSETDWWLPVHDPATQELLALVPQATSAELQAAVDAAARAFPKWRATSVVARQRILFELQRLVRANMDDIAAVITRELGKTQADARGDVLRGLRTGGRGSGHH